MALLLESQLADLKQQIAEHQPGADLSVIDRAYERASSAHKGQRRVSGESYMAHPVAVGAILAKLRLDVPTVAAALLHDVVEDTEITLADIEREFGSEVALLVDGVTKLSRLESRSQVEEQAENLRKMFLAMARDMRVILIKLADRLHNMRTLGYLPPEKQREISRETLEIFAPLAHRLGIFRIKWELEDLALRYLEPEVYRELAQRIPRRRKEREELAQQLIATLREHLREAGIEADIHGRAKHFYSIYQKMYRQGKELEEIYDLVAVRVIVETTRDCYAALGVIHTIWKPLPGRFKDYIATPKANLYQSLHTTVIGPHGEPFEIQIRTAEMHRTAEYGIAAHWRYKEGGKGDRDFEQKLAWLREVLEWQRDLKDAQEFMESLKIDIFTDHVFVFTPKGKVIELPAGATPIDFAYAIHTEIGHHCVGARINGRIAPLDTPLENGDIVEVLTSKQSQGPSADWLNIVQTPSARNRIRQWFKRANREENLQRGRDLCERELRRHGFDPVRLLRPEWLEEVARRLNLNSADDLLVNVGFGGIRPAQVMARLREIERRQARSETVPQLSLPLGRSVSAPPGGQGVQVRGGADNLLFRLSRCCNPVPGDAIVGYVTRGRGLALHRDDCPNVTRRLLPAERLIEVSWGQQGEAAYPVEIVVTGLDRPGLLSDVAQVMAETRINIRSATVRTGKDARAVIDLVVDVRNLEQLEVLRRRIERVRDVHQVERITRRLAH